MTFYQKYGFSKYSQHGEDGVIDECVRRINPIKICCEFGANNGLRFSNTFSLLEQGWVGYFYEENEECKTALMTHLAPYLAVSNIIRITRNNINQWVVRKLGVLSIDVDNDDYHLWKAYSGEADIVIIEINSGIIPPKEEVPGGSGASYTSMLKLGLSKGYFLICHTGNMIFALKKHRHLFPEIIGDGGVNWEEYWDKDLK